MSKVNLPSFLFYEADSQLRPTSPSLDLKGIEEFFPSVKFPTSALTFLYGHRNPAEPYLMELAAKRGLEAGMIEVVVEIGQWMRQKLDLSKDPDYGVSFTRFLSAKRIKRDLAAFVSDQWLKHVEPSADPNWPRETTRNPWVLDHLIKTDELKHLAVIAYEVETQEAGCFQVASVFDTDSIIGIDGGLRLRETEIVL